MRTSILKQALAATSLALASFTVQAQYCTPAFSTGCGEGDNIHTFVLPGESGAGIIDSNTGCSPNAYAVNLGMSATLAQGGAYPAFVSTEYGGNNLQVFVDFNDDGAFSASETIGGMNGLSDFGDEFTLHVPAGVTTGAHRMRLVLSYEYSYPGISACPTAAAGYDYGEVHDYSVDIIAGTGGPACDAPAYLSASGQTGTTAQIMWGAVAGAAGYEYLVDQNEDAPTGSGSLTSTNSYAATGLTANQVYYAHVRTQCSGTAFSSWVTRQFVTPFQPDCIAPDGFAATGISGTDATLTWNAPAGSSGTEIFLSSVPSLYPLNGDPIAGNAAQYNGLTPYTTYYGYLRHTCTGSGTVSDWAVISFTTSGSLTTPDATVSGAIYADVAMTPSADTYRVWLVQYDSLTTTLSAVDSQTVTSGYYTFSAMPEGNYLVKAAQLSALAFDSLAQVPTYHDSSLYWGSAQNIAVSAGAQLYKSIWMQHGTPTSGPGFISGNVSLGANKGTGNEVPGMYVYLRNAAGEMVQADATDATGNFSFGALPAGTYSVYPEYEGYETIPYPTITITGAQPVVPEINFNKDDAQRNIAPRAATGIGAVQEVAFNLAPNPAQGKVFLSNLAGDANVTVISAEGRVVMSRAVRAPGAELDIRALSPGVYLLRLQDQQGHTATRRLLVGR